VSGAVSSRWIGHNEATDIVREKVWRSFVDKSVNSDATLDHIPNIAYGERSDIRIDPHKVAAKGVDFETTAARRSRRPGKAAGFNDPDQDIFRDLHSVNGDTWIATTAHSRQIVDDYPLVAEAHDPAFDFIATKRELRAGQTLLERLDGGKRL
jgi:predicted thioesterase